jgi:hypothetical protein
MFQNKTSNRKTTQNGGQMSHFTMKRGFSKAAKAGSIPASALFFGLPRMP